MVKLQRKTIKTYYPHLTEDQVKDAIEEVLEGRKKDEPKIGQGIWEQMQNHNLAAYKPMPVKDMESALNTLMQHNNTNLSKFLSEHPLTTGEAFDWEVLDESKKKCKRRKLKI